MKRILGLLAIVTVASTVNATSSQTNTDQASDAHSLSTQHHFANVSLTPVK